MPCVIMGEKETSSLIKKEILVNGYDPETSTVYQLYGCKWHGCSCLGSGSSSKCNNTLRIESQIKSQGYNVVSVWECQTPELSKKNLGKKFVPYPYFIVYDFDSLLKKLKIAQTPSLTIDSSHIHVSVAINDNFSNNPTFIENSHPETLIKSFIEELTQRQKVISERVWEMYPMMDKESSPGFGFNSGKYDLNMIKEFFVKTLSDMNDVAVAEKDNSYLFLITPKFKFLDVKNYLAPGLSSDDWCERINVRLRSSYFYMNG